MPDEVKVDQNHLLDVNLLVDNYYEAIQLLDVELPPIKCRKIHTIGF